ncbi:unnamed protein product, partial [Musa acuminata subsp. burmannicoides]
SLLQLLPPVTGLLSRDSEVGISLSSSLSSFSSPLPAPSPLSSSSPPASSCDEVVSVFSSSASLGTSEGTVKLEALMSLHDVDSVVTKDLLRVLWDRYHIPECYGLHTPRPGQRPYDQFPNRFGLTVGVLEAGLQFPVHLIIRDCLHFWGISPSQGPSGYY